MILLVPVRAVCALAQKRHRVPTEQIDFGAIQQKSVAYEATTRCSGAGRCNVGGALTLLLRSTS